MIHLKEDFYFKFDKNEEMLVFLFLIFNANTEGEYVCSVRKLPEDIHISYNCIRNALFNLEKGGYITVSGCEWGTTIKIIDYHKYRTTAKKPNNKPDLESKVEIPTLPLETVENDNATDTLTIHTPTKEETEVERKERIFAERMQEEFPYVAKLKRPLKRTEWDNLIKRGYTKEELLTVLANMDNHQKLNSKYVYAYRTLLNWLKIEYGDKDTSTR